MPRILVNAKSQFLKTPLDLALDSGKDAAGVVKYLRSIGATCRADQPEADQAALDAVLKKDHLSDCASE